MRIKVERCGVCGMTLYKNDHAPCEAFMRTEIRCPKDGVLCIDDVCRSSDECAWPKRSDGSYLDPIGPAEGTRAGLPLLGKQVRVQLNEQEVVRGRLLSFGDSGEFVIEDEGGFVHYCWPMLHITEVGPEGAD